MSLIKNMPSDGIITINNVILKEGYTVDDLQERVAFLCENVKVYHSETGFIGGFVCLNTGSISNEGSTTGKVVDNDMKGRQALIVTFWTDYASHEASHRSETFQPLFQKVLEISESAEEPVYDLLWAGAAYSPEEAAVAKAAKEKYV